MNFKCAIASLPILYGIPGVAHADPVADIQLLKDQMELMQKQNQLQMQQMREKIDALLAAQAANRTPAAPPLPPVAAAAPGVPIANDSSKLTAHFAGAYATLYGTVDLSAETGYNGMQRINQVSSNESFLGVRGGKPLGSSGIEAVYQIETMAEISGTPAAASSLASRNSFAGISGPFGTIAIGKYDTPYKRATARMDPFAASLGDYNSIMGNTAGEGRTEFDYRMPHSIFYDSPNLAGFTANLLFSPGQKFNDLPASAKGASNYAFPQGESVCSGAQQPSLNGATPDVQGTGTTIQTLCDDGAFKTAWSAALNYENGPLYATLDWEVHQAVNRTSDAGGVVSTESAAKVGISYKFRTGNNAAAVLEKLYRNGGVKPATNERARSGYYFSDVQQLGNDFDAMAAWAHAGQTPGSPKFPGLKDGADMYSLGARYHFDAQGMVYVVGSYLKQGAGAHYGLGAGEGHGTPILSPRTATGGPLPGKSLSGISVGVQYAF